MENPFLIITGEQKYVRAQAIRVINREEFLIRVVGNDGRIEMPNLE